MGRGTRRQQSGPAPKAAHEKPALSPQTAVDSINTFANQSNQIKKSVKSVQEMDASAADSTGTSRPAPGPSGDTRTAGRNRGG